LLKIPVANTFRIILFVAVVTAATGISVFIASRIFYGGSTVIIRLISEMVFGAIGMVAGLYFARFIITQHPAVRYLARRLPIIAKLLPN